ncbi:cobalt-precorrin-5B (C(1))-methyltransferase [Amorphus coralli]|uniref:cobalt-precorrin-5B (C(1))-methyltransferase n=1 Tax=Amorphus coralli TaxID=340680 RepID=UPI000369F78A|nr:cobalt-precorrin-5B (C(1))-methyltransferase [Amorphus coralli]
MSRPSASERGALRRGWTTGACATAATKAAYTALVTGTFPDPVEILLPKGERPAFALAREDSGPGWAQAGIVKDAGDDPDVTHGALIVSTVRPGAPGTGIVFCAGPGVGTVTRPGLPVLPGEPAINPVPRALMRAVIDDASAALGGPADVEIEISIPSGEKLAAKTWNPRLGIEGGLSILGTTGIVHPFSCSAWIHSIHRGIDVARATGLGHVAGSTGSTSEAAVKAFHDLPDTALLDMGDFVGGMLKYLRNHPVDRVTVAGGFAKLTKLAQGFLDLHSGRSQVDFEWLAQAARTAGGSEAVATTILGANTAAEALSIARAADIDLAAPVALAARERAVRVVAGRPIRVDVLVVDRQGRIIAHAG